MMLVKIKLYWVPTCGFLQIFKVFNNRHLFFFPSKIKLNNIRITIHLTVCFSFIQRNGMSLTCFSARSLALQDKGLKRFKNVIDADRNMRRENPKIEMNISREPKLSGDGKYFAFVSTENVLKPVDDHEPRLGTHTTSVQVSYVNVSTSDGYIIHKDTGECVAWSPSGLLSYIQIVENNPILVIFDVDERKSLGRLEVDSTVGVIDGGHAMDWSFDGRYIAYVNVKSNLFVFSVTTYKEQLAITNVANIRLSGPNQEHELYAVCVAWSPCRLTLIISTLSTNCGYLYMADIADILKLDGQELTEHEPFSNIKSSRTTLVKWSPDGRYILTSSGKLGVCH